jgi:hypothetical protein
VFDLNEDFFVAPQQYTSGCRPIFWTRFGGPGGVYLPHLTKVAVSCASYLRRIDFSFDKEVPAECQRFGRLGDPQHTTRIEFWIDGPGGEVISKVELDQEFPAGGHNPPAGSRHEGSLLWVKLSTNRGRTCDFGRRSRSRHVVKREMSAAPGTAITGFYGSQVRCL